jgi:hypothetical protein
MQDNEVHVAVKEKPCYVRYDAVFDRKIVTDSLKGLASIVGGVRSRRSSQLNTGWLEYLQGGGSKLSRNVDIYLLTWPHIPEYLNFQFT